MTPNEADELRREVRRLYAEINMLERVAVKGLSSMSPRVGIEEFSSEDVRYANPHFLIAELTRHIDGAATSVARSMIETRQAEIAKLPTT